MLESSVFTDILEHQPFHRFMCKTSLCWRDALDILKDFYEWVEKSAVQGRVDALDNLLQKSTVYEITTALDIGLHPGM